MADVPGLEITTDLDVTNAIEEHCFSRVDVEVGGFLLGTVDGKSVHVTAAKPALAATSEQTHLTFTHEAWAEILDVMDTEYPGLAIVGWYHSHPGFGCFLSDYDIFIQENFFSGPGQHALVVDPLAGTWAQFVATGGESHEIAAGQTGRSALGGEAADKADVIALSTPRGHQRRWPAVVAAVVATGVVMGGLAWVMGNMQGQDSGRASAQARVDDAAATISDLESQNAAQASALAAASAQAADAAARATAAEAAASSAASTTPAPTPTATAEPTRPAGIEIGAPALVGITYVVKAGDNPWSIASRFLGSGTRFGEILSANPGLEARGLQVGDEIIVPIMGVVQGPAKTKQGGQ